MSEVKNFSLEFAGRTLSVEVGRIAQQTNASCLVTYGGTTILATAVMSKNARLGGDFFPLMVDVRENMYASGKIKGSRFVKREGRPTDNATLCGRMVDRGIRPLFNQEMRHEVQVVSTVLSYDGENTFDVVSIIASALALHISDIPWHGPLVGIGVGRVAGEWVINPTVAQLAQSDLKLVFSVADQNVVMVDAEAKEATEEDLMTGFTKGVEAAQPLLAFVEKIRSEVGKEKKNEDELIAAAYGEMQIALETKKALAEKMHTFCAPKLDEYLFNRPWGTKRERSAVAKDLFKLFVATLTAEENVPEVVDYLKLDFEEYIEVVVTKAILDSGRRVDGRSVTDVRSLSSAVGILPRTHGTGLFNRGETQVLSVVTLGAPGDAQLQDEMAEDDTKKSYIHYYNSPSYSFGEVGPFRGAGRREIGHGALAEKALIPVLPDKLSFPYTILVVSEVMSSNGSSSMASTCGSTLALLDAGVPLRKPVAGVAMGLASDGTRQQVITDLQDLEDGPGGMDFKVAGTADGVTAIQMDTKSFGISLDICRQTLTQAKAGRLQILANMATAIATHRPELSPYAPRIVSFMIDPAKIGEVIGTGGKIINKIIDECGVQIDIEDDGMVAITGVGSEGVAKAQQWVKDLIRDIEPGEIFTGTVVRLMDFGAFVEILPGRDGMVHISQFSDEHVATIDQVAKVGDKLKVKVMEIDDKGRINLSVKQADPNYVAKPRPEGDRGGFAPRRPSTGPRRSGPARRF